MDKAELIMTLLAELQEVLMVEPLTERQLLSYVNHLADVDPNALRYAFDQAANRCRFFPKIAELRDFSAQTPRHLLPALERTLLPQGTYHENGSAKLAEIIRQFDEWGPSTTRKQ